MATRIAGGLVLVLALPAGAAAPRLGMVKEYKLPSSTDPHEATTASDANVWVTVQGAFDPVTSSSPGSVTRVTPRGAITEFAVCDGCITNDLVQGPDGVLYISDNDGQLRRITTAGAVLGAISPCGEVFCDPLGGVAADATSIWFRRLLQQPGRPLRHRHGRVHSKFPTPAGGTPLEIAAAPDGDVWFTQNLRGNVARITPDGVVTEASKAIDFASPKRPDPIGITIGANGDPWYALSLTDKVANLKLR